MERLRIRFEEIVASLSQRDRMLLAGMLVMGTVLFLGGGFWLASRKVADLESRVSDKQHTLSLLKSMQADQEAAAGQIAAIEERLKSAAGQDLPAFVEKSAQSAGIAANLQSVREKGMTTDGNLEEKTYQVEISKITLQQMVDFLHALETGGYPLKVRSSRTKTVIVTGVKSLNVSLEVAAFRLVDAASGAAGEATP